MMEKILIVMINYNSYIDTEEIVEALYRQSYNEFELVIIDNASHTDVDKLINLSEKYKFNLILAKDNLGFAGGNNFCIRNSDITQYSYVLLLNNDTYVDDNFLQQLINGSKRHQNAVISPKIVDYYNREKIMNAGGDTIDYKGGVKVYGTGELSLLYENDKKITFAHGCCMLIPVEVLQNVGLMKESYFLYYEDTDYSRRIIESGYKIWYIGDCIVYHKESSSTGLYSKVYQYYFLRSRFMYIKNNISYPIKIVAYIYTCAFWIRAILGRRFTWRYSLPAVVDFIKGKEGIKLFDDFDS